jgi:hypothetical protein
LLGKENGLHDNIDSKELENIAAKISNNNGCIIKVERKAMDLLHIQREQIAQLLKEPNMTHSQIQRLLFEEGIYVSERSVNRFIERNFNKKKCTVHLKTTPGEEGQVDFGYVGMMKDEVGNLRRTYAFVMTLSHSRHRYVEFSTSQNAMTWAQLHINAFEFFKGVPKCVLLDNLKAGVIKADIYDPVLNGTYAELSRFYGFVIDPAKVRKPEHKGKIERSIRIVKEQLIAGRNYKNIAIANIEAKQWCNAVISQRICTSTGKKPGDVFEQEEKVKLIPLPQGFFDMPEWVIAKVHQDHHFTVKSNFYSVPTQYIGEEIEVRIGLKTITAYHKHNIMKTHPRNFGKGQWVTDEKDYPQSALHFLDKSFEVCLQSAHKIGQATYIMIDKCCKPGSKVGLRKAQGILRLAEKYNNERLEKACQRAIVFNNYSYDCLFNILSKGLDNEVPVLHPDTQAVSYVRPKEEYQSGMEVNYVN